MSVFARSPMACTITCSPARSAAEVKVYRLSGGVTSGDLSVDIGGAAAGSINLSANPSNVPASGGTSTVLAVVFDVDGNRLPGVPVSFTSTAGSLSSTVVVTNSQGEALTTITTNRDADVTASTGGSGSGDGARAAVTATVKITADGAALDAEFAINRKDFGIMYAGRTNDLIRDEVVLKLYVRAPRAGARTD